MQSAVPTGSGRAPFACGSAYARAGAVGGLGVSAEGSVLFASVQGSRAEPYQVMVRARADQWSGDCSCPMGGDYKHIVVVLLTVRDSGPIRESAPVVPAWERRLSDLSDQ